MKHFRMSLCFGYSISRQAASLHPSVDHFHTTACPQVFYSSINESIINTQLTESRTLCHSDREGEIILDL